MARNSKSGTSKNYYFLRLPTDHEKSDTSKRLIYRAGNDGYGLYIRLLEKAAPKFGLIEFAGIEEDIKEQLAFDLDISLDQTCILLDTLNKLGLVEPAGDESKDLFFREAEMYTKTETPEARRQQRYRDKNKGSYQSNGEALQSNGEALQSNGEALQNNGEALQSNDNNIYNNSYNNSYNNNYKNSYNAEIESILSAYPMKERQENARIEIEQRIEEGEEPEKLLNAAKMYALKVEGADTIRIFPDNFYKKNGKYLSYKDMKPDEVTRYAKKQEPEKRQPNNKITFQNYEQRTYDYKALEALLLGSPNEGAADKEETGNDYP